MGGERASTTRRRERGQICAMCHAILTLPARGERLCARCQPRRRVYMHYMSMAQGWYCQFLEEDLKTPLPRKLTFQGSDKVVQMAERGGAEMNLAGRQALDHGISIGRGGVWLMLDAEQYGRLKTRPGGSS